MKFFYLARFSQLSLIWNYHCSFENCDVITYLYCLLVRKSLLFSTLPLWRLLYLGFCSTRLRVSWHRFQATVMRTRWWSSTEFTMKISTLSQTTGKKLIQIDWTKAGVLYSSSEICFHSSYRACTLVIRFFRLRIGQLKFNPCSWPY